MPALAPVLAHLDAGLDGSLERLFGLLAIKSISTDPAYAAECRRAARPAARQKKAAVAEGDTTAALLKMRQTRRGGMSLPQCPA